MNRLSTEKHVTLIIQLNPPKMYDYLVKREGKSTVLINSLEAVELTNSKYTGYIGDYCVLKLIKLMAVVYYRVRMVHLYSVSDMKSHLLISGHQGERRRDVTLVKSQT